MFYSMHADHDGQVDPRLVALDHWISKLHWYDKLLLILPFAILVALPVELMNVAAQHSTVAQNAIAPGVVVRSGMGLLPDMVRTTEIYVVACRNAGEPQDVAKSVAIKRAVGIAYEYGTNSVPKLVTDRIEEQIQKHYRRPPATATGEVTSMYSCDVR